MLNKTILFFISVIHIKLEQKLYTNKINQINIFIPQLFKKTFKLKFKQVKYPKDIIVITN